MAGGLVAEVALQAAIDGVCSVFSLAIKRVTEFDSILAGLQITVNSKTAEINSISQLESHKFLEDKISKLRLLLEQAKDLINRCSQISRWNYYKKYKYSKKLCELDASLSRFSADLPLPILVQFLDNLTKHNKLLDRILHDKSPNGTRARFTELKKIVLSLQIWILTYLSWFKRIHWPSWGYGRITTRSSGKRV